MQTDNRTPMEIADHFWRDSRAHGEPWQRVMLTRHHYPAPNGDAADFARWRAINDAVESARPGVLSEDELATYAAELRRERAA